MGKTKCIKELEFYGSTDYKVTTRRRKDDVQMKLRGQEMRTKFVDGTLSVSDHSHDEKVAIYH